MSSSILSNISNKKVFRKGQMQLMETVGVLFVFFLILVFALIFYAGFQKDKLKDMSSEKTELELVTIAQTITSLPELKCSGNQDIKELCFEELSIKIMADNMDIYLSPDNIQTRLYFTTLFKDSNITIAIYDEKNEVFNYTEIYFMNNESKTNKRTNYVPLKILDSRTGEYKFGILYLSVFI